jgi:hypothetical protein
LIDEGLHPFAHLPAKDGRPPKCFAQGQWSVYLDTVDDVLRAVRYVEENPLKEGKPRQRWGFVSALDGSFGMAPRSAAKTPRRG